jgi:hypothetical protein
MKLLGLHYSEIQSEMGMQCKIEFGYQVSIFSGTEEKQTFWEELIA